MGTACPASASRRTSGPETLRPGPQSAPEGASGASRAAVRDGGARSGTHECCGTVAAAGPPKEEDETSRRLYRRSAADWPRAGAIRGRAHRFERALRARLWRIYHRAGSRGAVPRIFRVGFPRIGRANAPYVCGSVAIVNLGLARGAVVWSSRRGGDHGDGGSQHLR